MLKAIEAIEASNFRYKIVENYLVVNNCRYWPESNKWIDNRGNRGKGIMNLLARLTMIRAGVNPTQRKMYQRK